MKTESQIKKRLKEVKADLKKIQKRFEEYDNHEDMDLIMVTKETIETLEWILKV